MKKWILEGICILCVLTLFLSGCATSPEDISSVAVEPIVIDPDESAGVAEPVVIAEPVVEPIEPIVDLTEENAALILEGTKARELAIVAGAAQYFPDELLVIDIVAREAQVVYEDGGDSVVFNETASDIVYQYRALEQASLGSTTQLRIDELGFENYNPEQYAIGMEAALQAEEMFNTGAMGKDLYEKTKIFADASMLVLKAGFVALAEIERDKFLEYQEKADAIKANIADKEGYADAVLFFTQAKSNLLEDDPESAYNNFAISANDMREVYEAVSIKRAVAEDAMMRAKRRTEESNEVAVNADAIVPLGDVEALATTETDDVVETDEVIEMVDTVQEGE